MSTHIYAFGSICRGEIDEGSDIDLLACLSSPRKEIDPKKFSIYTYERVKELWCEGNPFAWHIHLESRLIFSSDGSDFIKELGLPSRYNKASEDCIKFKMLFSESYESLMSSSNSVIFHLSCMFLAARNFATCYSFGSGKPIFSRVSPLLLDHQLPISRDVFDIFVRARILSTRGYGDNNSNAEVSLGKSSAPIFLDWMNELYPEEKFYE